MRIQAAAAIALALIACMPSHAGTAPAERRAEDTYIEARDNAIKRINALVAPAMGETAMKTEESARAELESKMLAVLGPLAYDGFGPGKLNLETLFKEDQGFAMLDGLRFDAKTGTKGEIVGDRRPDGTFVEPKAHIIVTTETLLARWLAAQKMGAGKSEKRASQLSGLALADESFYTHAISTDAAVFKFGSLPVAKPRTAALAVAMLAGRSQSEIPDSADEIFGAVSAKGKVYIVYGTVEPSVKPAACLKIRFDFVTRLEQANADADNIRHVGEKAFKQCFARHAPGQTAFTEASRQAQAMLDTAVGR